MLISLLVKIKIKKKRNNLKYDIVIFMYECIIDAIFGFKNFMYGIFVVSLQ